MEVRTVPIEIERPPERPNIPNPKPIELIPFEWEVLTPEKLPDEESWVRFSLTVAAYEDLARNMAEILRWVNEAQWRLDYYRGEGALDGLEFQGSEVDDVSVE